MKATRLAWIALLAAVLIGCGTENAESLIAEGRTALDNGDLKAASVHLRQALEKNPESAAARFQFARLMFEAGDFKAAEIELNKALEREYPAEEAAPLMARVLLARHQYKKILDAYSKFEISDPARRVDLSTSVATALALSGSREASRSLVASLVASAPDNVRVRLLEARLIAGGGDVDAALKVLDQVVTKSPRSTEAWRLQGDLLLYGKQDRPKALQAYRKVLEIRADDIDAHTRLIESSLVDKNLQEAKQQHDILSKLQPAHVQTVFLGATIALHSGDAKLARTMAAQLLKRLGDNPKVLLIAAAADLQLNALIQAESSLNKILSAQPGAAEARRLLATVHLRSGRSAKALEVLGPLLGDSTSDREALSLAAEAHLMSGSNKDAEAFFARVTRIKPDDVKARTALALSQLARGDVSPALEKLQAIAGSDKGTLADMALIQARLRQRDLDGALKAIDSLEIKTPTKALPSDLRGRVFLIKQDASKARTHFEKALTLDPVFFPSAAELAKIDLAEKKPAAAQARFEAMLKADAKNVRALVALATLRTTLGAKDDEVAQLLIRAVDAAPGEPSARVLLVDHWLKQGNARQALSVAQSALAAMPDEPSLLEALGRSQLANDEVAQALNTFGKLASNQPNSAFAHLRIADVQMRANNRDAAERALRRALEISPELIAAQRGLIALAIQAKQPEKALAVARTIQRQRPKDAVGHVLEGNAHAQFKDWDKAALAFRGGLQKRGGATAAVRLYGVLRLASRKAEASQFVAEWLKKDPKDTVLRRYLAAEAVATGDYAQAEQRYGEVLALQPRNAAAANDLAWVLAKNKKPGAVAMAERAVALAPDNANMLDTLAFALGEENQLQRAIEAAKSALQLPSHTPAVRLTLAKLYLKANDKPSARAELDELTKLGAAFPSHLEVAELRKGL